MSEFFGTFSWPKFIEALPVWAAAGAAIFLLWQSKGDASRRAAFEYLRTDAEDTEGRKNITSIMQNTPDSTNLFNSDGTCTEDGKTLRAYLNKREVMAGGILARGLHEKTVKDMLAGSLVYEWEYAYPFIEEIRKVKNMDDGYGYFEKIAKKWSKNKIKNNE